MTLPEGVVELHRTIVALRLKLAHAEIEIAALKKKIEHLKGTK